MEVFYRMTRRVWVLLVLAAVTLLYRGLATYQHFSKPEFLFGSGLNLSPEGRYLTITSIKEKDSSGHPTPAFLAGGKAKDKILAIYNMRDEGGPIRGWFDYEDAAKKIEPGKPWVMHILRGSGPEGTQELRLTLPNPSRAFMSIDNRLFLISLQVVIPLIAIITALLIGVMKPEDDKAFLASLLFFSFSSIFATKYTGFPPGLRIFTLVFHTTLNSFVVYLFMRFFLLFPSPSIIERKAPWLKQFGLGVTIMGWLLNVTANYTICTSFERYSQLRRVIPRGDLIFNWVIFGMFVIGVLSLVYNTMQAATKDERRRMVIILSGTIAGLLPLVVYLFYRRLSGLTGTPPIWLIAILVLALGIFPLSFVYAVVKHRVLGIRVILRRGLQYALVTRAFLIVEAVVIFVLLYFASQTVFRRFFAGAGLPTITAYTALVTLAVAAVLHRINQPIMHSIDRRFFREAYNAQQVLTELGRAVRQLAVQPGNLINIVTDKIGESMHPDQVAVFLRGAEVQSFLTDRSPEMTSLVHLRGREADRFHCCALRLRSGRHDVPYPIESGDEWALASDSFITRYLEKFSTDEPEALEVYLDDPKSWASMLARVDSRADGRYWERALLERLNTRLIVPLVTSDRLLGFISLGEKLSEEPYTKDDRQLLLTVAQQTAIALDYAQLINQVAEQEKLKREIEIAKEVQEHLFPQTRPPMRTLEYTGICQAARGVGGDYYDFLPLGLDKLGLALGDISGKGISAALLMASLQAMLRSYAPTRRDQVDALICTLTGYCTRPPTPASTPRSSTGFMMMRIAR